jgi:hypothetical protein
VNDGDVELGDLLARAADALHAAKQAGGGALTLLP